MLSSSLVPFWGNFCDILRISPRLPTMYSSKEGKFCSLWFILLVFKFALQWSEYLLWNNNITNWGYSILYSMSYCIALCYITSYYIVLQSVGMWTSCSLILRGHAVLQSASLPALAPDIGIQKGFCTARGLTAWSCAEARRAPCSVRWPWLEILSAIATSCSTDGSRAAHTTALWLCRGEGTASIQDPSCFLISCWWAANSGIGDGMDLY